MTKPRLVEFAESAGRIGGGSVILALILFAVCIYEHLKTRNVPALLLFILALLSYGYGCFMAWLSAKKQVEIEQQKRSLPDFSLALGQTLTMYDGQTDSTIVCLSATLINAGSDSLATNWIARYQSPTLDTTVGFLNLPDAEFEWLLANGRYLILRRDQMLSARTAHAIFRGHGCSGRLLFSFQGNRRAEILAGAAQIWLGCHDFTGRLCQAVFQGGYAYEAMTFAASAASVSRKTM